MLSIISVVANHHHEDRRGIFAGGIVFGTLLLEMQLTVGGIVFKAFSDRSRSWWSW